jgi:hypothetical protein
MKNKLQILTTLIFLGFVGWWISFQHVVLKQGSSVNWFENTYGIMALIGSIIGFCAVKKWGGLKTVLGKSLLLFSLGLFAQEAGQLISSYYTQVDKEALPYPSWGDAAFFGSVLIYFVAAVYLTKMVGIKFALKKSHAYKLVALLVPLVLIIGSFLILLHNHQYDTSKPLTVFLDAGYPIVQASYVSAALVAYLLSRKMLGGIMKAGVLLIVLALFVQYVSDFIFIYQNNHTVFVPGKFDDLFYLIAYYIMTLAMIRFHVIYKKLQPANPASPSHADKGEE